MSYRFVDGFRAGPGWNWFYKTNFILVLLKSCLQTCITYTNAVCIVNKLLMTDRRTVRTCRVSCQNKFVKLVHLVGFYYKILCNYVMFQLLLRHSVTKFDSQYCSRWLYLYSLFCCGNITLPITRRSIGKLRLRYLFIYLFKGTLITDYVKKVWYIG